MTKFFDEFGEMILLILALALFAFMLSGCKYFRGPGEIGDSALTPHISVESPE